MDWVIIDCLYKYNFLIQLKFQLNPLSVFLKLNDVQDLPHINQEPELFPLIYLINEAYVQSSLPFFV